MSGSASGHPPPPSQDGWAPVERFLPGSAAHLLAGRLTAEGIEALVVRQPQSFYAYHTSGTGPDVSMLLVRERDAARAVWLLDAIRAEAEAAEHDR